MAKVHLVAFTSHYQGVIEKFIVAIEDEKTLTSIVLPLFKKTQLQMSFVEGVSSNNEVKDLFYEQVLSDPHFSIWSKSRSKVTFHFPKQDFYHTVHILQSMKQWGIAQVLLSSPPDFSQSLRVFSLWKHWHIDSRFTLHLHEQTGTPGNRRDCTKGAFCSLAADCPTEADLFTQLGMPFLPMHHRTVSAVREQEQYAFSLR